MKNLHKIINEICSEMFPKLFPSLEKISEEFINKNKFSPIKEKVETNKGLILQFDEGIVILSSQCIEIEKSMEFHFPIGGSGNTARTYNEQTYTLEGKINNKEISLKATIQYSQKYIFTKKGFPREFAQQAKKIGKPESKISRLDKEKYWFITDYKEN